VASPSPVDMMGGGLAALKAKGVDGLVEILVTVSISAEN
jgi:hypothetical protein